VDLEIIQPVPLNPEIKDGDDRLLLLIISPPTFTYPVEEVYPVTTLIEPKIEISFGNPTVQLLFAVKSWAPEGVIDIWLEVPPRVKVLEEGTTLISETIYAKVLFLNILLLSTYNIAVPTVVKGLFNCILEAVITPPTFTYPVEEV